MKRYLFTLPALAVCLIASNLEAQTSSYSDWAATYLANYPDESAPMDDPGDFGVPNFVRYSFALKPFAPFPCLQSEPFPVIYISSFLLPQHCFNVPK